MLALRPADPFPWRPRSPPPRTGPAGPGRGRRRSRTVPPAAQRESSRRRSRPPAVAPGYATSGPATGRGPRASRGRPVDAAPRARHRRGRRELDGEARRRPPPRSSRRPPPRGPPQRVRATFDHGEEVLRPVARPRGRRQPRLLGALGRPPRGHGHRRRGRDHDPPHGGRPPRGATKRAGRRRARRLRQTTTRTPGRVQNRLRRPCAMRGPPTLGEKSACASRMSEIERRVPRQAGRRRLRGPIPAAARPSPGHPGSRRAGPPPCRLVAQHVARSVSRYWR